MNRDPVTYDDDVALTGYVWHNYRHLMSDEERLTDMALMGAAKIDAYTKDGVPPGNVKWYHKHFGRLDDPVVARQLIDGTDAFRRRIRDRLLDELPNEVFVNRCGQCNRIVLTPQAKQCRWCGHDWH